MNANNKVLIVDDDEILLLILKNAFELKGYQVFVTSQSELALKMFELHRPCTVVIDIFMPEKDGFEVLKEIRGRCQQSFIMALSSRGNHLATIRLLGADEALHKSTLPEVIVDTVIHSSIAKVRDNTL